MQTFLFTVNGGWGDWTPYGACSKGCGDGTHTRTRECDDPPESNGGLDCPGESTETSPCNEKACQGKWFNILYSNPNFSPDIVRGR